MQTEVVICLPNGVEIECTARSAKYLIIGLGLEVEMKAASVSSVPAVDCAPLVEAEPAKPTKCGKSKKTA